MSRRSRMKITPFSMAASLSEVYIYVCVCVCVCVCVKEGELIT